VRCSKAKTGLCPECYYAVHSCGRSSCVDVAADRKHYRLVCRMSKFLRRPDPENEVNLSAPPGDVSLGLAADFPALYEYLTCCQWEDGEARVSATLLAFVESGSWRLCLNDRENSRSCWASGSSILEAARSLEGMLSSGCASWRSSNGPPRKR